MAESLRCIGDKNKTLFGILRCNPWSDLRRIFCVSAHRDPSLIFRFSSRSAQVWGGITEKLLQEPRSECNTGSSTRLDGAQFECCAKPVIWDITVLSRLAHSYLHSSNHWAEAAADVAASFKKAKWLSTAVFHRQTNCNTRSVNSPAESLLLLLSFRCVCFLQSWW